MNRFGEQSRLFLQVSCENGRSFLRDRSFTAPFKVMKPFYDNRGMRIMVLCASAGLMAGDDQLLEVRLDADSQVQLDSQAADKVHAMPSGMRATRRIEAHLAHKSSLIYTPLPLIPFADSALVATNSFELEDATARLVYCDIIAAGRIASGERFTFRELRNRVFIRQAGRPVYAENTVFLPRESKLEGLTLFEGYTHTGTMLLVNHKLGDERLAHIAERCRAFDGSAGFSLTGSGALCIKTLAQGSEPIQALHDELISAILENAKPIQHPPLAS